MEVAIIATAATVLGSAYYTKANADNQKKALKQSNAYAIQNAALQDQQAKLALNEQQRKNKNLLAQQQSTYKAKLGANGISIKNGSAQAYLDSAQREYDIEDKYLVNQSKIPSDALLNSLNQTTNTNLLKLNTLNNNNQQSLYTSLGNLTGGTGHSLIK